MIRNSHGDVRVLRLLALAVAALAPVLAGCEAGNNAPTMEWHQPTAGTGLVHHGVAVRNMFVLGAPLGASLRPGQSASLFLAVYNGSTTPDTLLSISAPGTAKSVTLPGGAVPLAMNRMVLLTGPAPKVILTDLSRQVNGGSAVRLVLNFQNAGRVAVSVPVMPQAQYYSTLLQAPTPTPRVTRHRHHARAARGASPTPTPTSTG